ncbi:21206_t:CDS:1, partial [Gigaspora rosea]
KIESFLHEVGKNNWRIVGFKHCKEWLQTIMDKATSIKAPSLVMAKHLFTRYENPKGRRSKEAISTRNNHRDVFE